MGAPPLSGRASRFALLLNRNFRLLLLGQTTSALGGAMVPIALSFAILADGGTALDIGLVFGTVSIAELMLFMVGGVAADRHSRRLVMVLADAVRGASQLAIAALLITGHPPIIALCACTAVQGVAGSFFAPAETALLPAVVESGELQPANGLTQIATSAAGVLGPAVAGVLVVTIGGGWAIAINGASFLLNAALLTQVRAREPERERAAGAGVLGQMREGWSAFVAIDWYLTIACSFSLVQVFVGAYFSVGPVVAKEYLGGAGAWAAILTVGGIGSAVGGLAVIHLQPRRPLAAAMLFSVPFCLMPLAVALTLPVAVLCALSAIAGVGVLLTLTLFDTVVQRAVAPEVLGRVFAIDLSLSGAGPDKLLITHPAWRAITSRTGGSPSRAERSRKASPTTSSSHVGRTAATGASSMTPWSRRTICNPGILAGRCVARTVFSRARSATVPPDGVGDRDDTTGARAREATVVPRARAGPPAAPAITTAPISPTPLASPSCRAGMKKRCLVRTGGARSCRRWISYSRVDRRLTPFNVHLICPSTPRRDAVNSVPTVRPPPPRVKSGLGGCHECAAERVESDRAQTTRGKRPGAGAREPAIRRQGPLGG